MSQKALTRLLSSTEASSAESLTLSGGTLTGAGTLDVSESLSWMGGTMSGSGATVLESGSTGSINPGSGGSAALTERTLTNRGSEAEMFGSRLSPLEGREWLEHRRFQMRETKPIFAGGPEHARTEADRDRQLRGVEADRLAGVLGRLARFLGSRLVRPTGCQRCRSRRPFLQQAAEVFDGAAGEIERGEAQIVLGRGRDPGLVGAVERHRALGRLCSRLRVGCLVRELSDDMVKPRADSKQRGAGEYPATGQAHVCRVIGDAILVIDQRVNLTPRAVISITAGRVDDLTLHQCHRPSCRFQWEGHVNPRPRVLEHLSPLGKVGLFERRVCPVLGNGHEAHV